MEGLKPSSVDSVNSAGVGGLSMESSAYCSPMANRPTPLWGKKQRKDIFRFVHGLKNGVFKTKTGIRTGDRDRGMGGGSDLRAK